MNYEQALAYLDSFVNYERWHAPEAMRTVKPARMRRLLQRLGHPDRRFRSVVVTGTNGKGSICAMLYAMLRESQLRAGLYTSPHLDDVRERIRASSRAEDDWIPQEAFAQIVQRMSPILNDMRREGLEWAPTYFEVLTAIALVYFHEQRVDVAILEVGLGGRLDATNAVEHAVSVIGPIELDHTDVLGHDVISITMEKAGIIRDGQTVISAAQRPEVDEVLRSICEAYESPYLVCGRQISADVLRHDRYGLQVAVNGLRGRYDQVSIPLIGRHQAQNAAMAVAALESLAPEGVPYGIVERGLAAVRWPGRIEFAQDDPLVILDGGHNPHATQRLKETLEELCPGKAIHLLIAVSADKAVDDVIRPLAKLAVSATCTSSRHPRALEPTALATHLLRYCPDVHVMSDPADAYTYLINAVPANEVVVVAGSLFLVGEIRAAARRGCLRARPAPQLDMIT